MLAILPLPAQNAPDQLSTDSAYVLLPDSSNFVTASLLVASPAAPVYSVFGHCALRMQCPIHNLDYVFTLDMMPDAAAFVKYFAGKARSAVEAVPTAAYLDAFSAQGRSVEQYDLNLTLHEKQLLWKNLDDAIMRGPVFEFNLINTNCVQMSMLMIEQSLIGEQFDAGTLPSVMLMNNGDLMRYYTQESRWLQFALISLMGAASDGSEVLEYKLSPSIVPQVLQEASFVSEDGFRRPVLTGDSVQLLPLRSLPGSTSFTPLVAFAALLLLVLIVTWLELRKGWRKVPRAVDALLLTAQTLLGCLLVYTTFVSCLFGTHWNWYLIPFNPLPAIIWLLWHRKPSFYNVYWLYAAVLVVFLLLWPVSVQIDLEHQLLTATLLVRCLAHGGHRSPSAQKRPLR